MSASNHFDFTKDYILEDERVLLRPIKLGDIEFLSTYVQTEPEIWNYSLMTIQSQADLEKYIKIDLEARETKK